MDETYDVTPERVRLDFPSATRRHFSFLGELGFREAHALSTIVSYVKGDLLANVYHGRRSYELGFEAGRAGAMYSISALIRIADQARAQDYRNFVAMTAEQVDSGTERLAQLVRRYAEPALRGDEALFQSLQAQKADWAATFALDVLSRQLKPQANKAFQEQRYGDAVRLFERILPRLSPAELKKLDVARKRSG